MTLYLSSDEKTLDESNTRTKFKNEILPDFFKTDSFNLELQEIFFDAKFPTLVNFEYPYIITTVIGKEHQLQDFPIEFQQNSLFKYLCKKYKNGELSPLLVEKQAVLDSEFSEIDFEVFYKIHPRFNFAFSIAFIKDVNIHSQKDVISFLNSFMFPFHKKKPLMYMDNGHVEIKSNLDIFLSVKLLQLLGFTAFESSISENRLSLPLMSRYKNPNFIEDDYAEILTHKDMLSIAEEESDMYSNYRALDIHKPRGCIKVEFTIGSYLHNFEVEYELDLFHQKTKIINYDQELLKINRLMREKYLSLIKENVLNLKISILETDIKDLDDFIEFLSKSRANLQGLEDWGGLFTLKRTKHNHVNVTVFQKELYRDFHTDIQQLPGGSLMKQASMDVFLSSSLKNISFNPALCHLLGVSESSSSFVTIQMEGEQEKILPFPLNYYRCMHKELEKSHTETTSLGLQLLRIQEETFPESNSFKLIKTNHEDMYMIDRRGVQLFGDQVIDMKMNSPHLIFVQANFVQHSLVGSNQRKILDFFPLPTNSNEIVHHRFKKPVILKMIPGSVFHINLVDENFNQIKADIGAPTLLGLKKSFKENMFPVTLISSDKTNYSLFPENKPNSFKNKLSFPLLLNQEHKWGVSLRSMAYPKVMNISSKYCFFTVKQIGQEKNLTIHLDNAYVTSAAKLIYLLNQKVQDKLATFIDSVLPTFSLKDGYTRIETNDFECHLNGHLLKILGLTHSYQDKGIVYHPSSSMSGVLEMNLFLLQPQEMIIMSNIVEEAFYAQHRPKILKIVPISNNQSNLNAYNYIQFDDEDTIPVKLDRIDEIEISIVTRKGDLVEFVNLQDVKCQLEFKRIP